MTQGMVISQEIRRPVRGAGSTPGMLCIPGADLRNEMDDRGSKSDWDIRR
jgi:hypothetical protein